MDLSFWNKAESYVMENLIPQLRLGKCFIDLDGKIRFTKKLGAEIPWVFIRGRDFGDCYLYKDVWFDWFKIIPSFCQYFCWKIIIRPKTVKELFELFELLKKHNYPGKCGIETRNYVDGHYAGFVYNNSEEEGQKRYQILKKQINPDTPIFLKRGCTEFELNQPSDQWSCDEFQKEVEMVLMKIFETSSEPPFQPQLIINYVKRSWIYHAFKIQDLTYKEIIPETDWKLFPVSLQYQQEINEPEKDL